MKKSEVDLLDKILANKKKIVRLLCLLAVIVAGAFLLFSNIAIKAGGFSCEREGTINVNIGGGGKSN